jgi:hypothetical protein
MRFLPSFNSDVPKTEFSFAFRFPKYCTPNRLDCDQVFGGLSPEMVPVLTGNGTGTHKKAGAAICGRVPTVNFGAFRPEFWTLHHPASFLRHSFAPGKAGQLTPPVTQRR